MDMRLIIKRSSPSNKLTDAECESALKIVNLPEYADLLPSQIVPAPADRVIYIASESTMYRILKKERMQTHRGYARVPKKKKEPETHIANKPNQVWIWDITYLSTVVVGLYFKLYMIVDIFSRKIVGWEVRKTETGEFQTKKFMR